MNCIIVGVGNIGTELYKEYSALKPDRYDPKKGYFEKRSIKYDIAFLSVDSPMKEDGSCDLSQVKTALSETDSELYVIRSTVPPKTTEALVEETGKKIVYSPEFYGMTNHSGRQRYDFDFMIIGGNKEWSAQVVQILQNVYDARYRFLLTDSRTAELTKYFENTFLATKVSLCIQFWNIAKEIGVSYEEMRELLLNDKRINRSHTFVYEEHPYWESHCFDKDLRALVNFADAPFVEEVIRYNEMCKEKCHDSNAI